VVSISVDSDEPPVSILAASGKEASEKTTNVAAPGTFAVTRQRLKRNIEKAPAFERGYEDWVPEPAARLRLAAVRWFCISGRLSTTLFVFSVNRPGLLRCFPHLATHQAVCPCRAQKSPRSWEVTVRTGAQGAI